MTGLQALTVEKAARPSPGWVKDAACRFVDPELFFDTGQDLITMTRGFLSKANQLKRRQAKAICASCPIIVQCREHYLDETHGVYGGLDRDERNALRQARKAIADAQADGNDIGRQAYQLFVDGASLTVLARKFGLRPGQLRIYLDDYLASPDGQQIQLERKIRELCNDGKSDVQIALRLGITVVKASYLRRRLGLADRTPLSEEPVRVTSSRWDSSVKVMGQVLSANYLGESADDPPFFFMQIKYSKASTRKWMHACDVQLGEGVRRHVISKGVGSGKKRKRPAGDQDEVA